VTNSFTAIVDSMTLLGLKRFLAVSGSAEMKKMALFRKLCTALLKCTSVGHTVRNHDGGLKVLWK
jgi:hypothetical protein